MHQRSRSCQQARGFIPDSSSAGSSAPFSLSPITPAVPGGSGSGSDGSECIRRMDLTLAGFKMRLPKINSDDNQCTMFYNPLLPTDTHTHTHTHRKMYNSGKSYWCITAFDSMRCCVCRNLDCAGITDEADRSSAGCGIGCGTTRRITSSPSPSSTFSSSSS